MEDKQIQTPLTENIPDWKLKLAYFYASHKIVVKKASIFTLFFVDLVIVFMLGSILVNYQTGTINNENQLSQLPNNLVNTEAVSKQMPEELTVRDVRVVETTGDKYNMMVAVKNNNSEWAVTRLDYTFTINGKDLETRSSFVLPKSEKYLMYFNADNGVGAKLKILNTQWMRVKDFSLLSYKDGVKVMNATYEPSRTGQLSGDVIVELYNDTPYGWWEVGVPIILHNRGGDVLAIDYIVINKLKSQETRELTVSWHEVISESVREVEVYPEINLLDEGVVMPLDEPIGSPPGLE